MATVYVYRRRNSTGARDLVEGILMAGTHARRTKGDALRNVQPTDAVVCWGDNFAAPAGVRTLNNVAPISKFREAQALRAVNISTVQVSQTRPAQAAAARALFVEGRFNLQAVPQLSVADAAGIVARLQAFTREQAQLRAAWNAQPAQPAEIWLPRRNNHVGGTDLLEENLREADYYSKKENIVEEYRLHMFLGKSIRAGKKIAQATRPDGRTAPHEWIRSFDAGWNIRYDGFESTKAMRDLAAAAVKALNLDFAAVDIGKRADGSLLVLECNRAPGVEGGTVAAYARKIAEWFAGNVEVARG